MQNPFVGLVNEVTVRQVPSKAKPGTTFAAYEIFTAAGKFQTTDAKKATIANAAKASGHNVLIRWAPTVNGKYTNYNISEILQQG